MKPVYRWVQRKRKFYNPARSCYRCGISINPHTAACKACFEQAKEDRFDEAGCLRSLSHPI